MKKQQRNFRIPAVFGFSSFGNASRKSMVVGGALLLFLMVDVSLVTPSLVTASASPEGSFQGLNEGLIATRIGGNNQLRNQKFVTKTVAGFVDFVTTVGNTVMIFTPRVNGAEDKESTLTVTPTKVVPTASVRFSFDQEPTIGIQGLFQDFQRPSSFPSNSQIKSSFGETRTEVISPTSVRSHQEKIKHLANGLIEVDGAIDAPKFDRASAEPAVEIAEETYRIVNAAHTPTAELPKTITRVASTTLFSNFVGGRNQQVGLVTGTGGTLISNGITTVHTTRVFGTYLNNNGQDSYAQVVQSTAKVFEEEIYPTSVTNFGSVQHVTERPSFGLDSVDDVAKKLQPRSNDNDIFTQENKGFGSVQVLDSKDTRKTNRLTIGKPSHKTSAIDSFKARLKNRFQKFKQKQNQLKQKSASNKFSRGSVAPVHSSSVSNSGSGGRRLTNRRSRKERTRFKSRDSRERKIDVVEDIEEDEEVITEPPRKLKSKGSRGFKFNKSRFRTRNRETTVTTERTIDEDVLFGQSSFKVSSSVSGRNRYRNSNDKRRGGSNRFRDRVSPAKTRRIEPSATKDVASSFNLRRPEEPEAPSFKPKKPKLSFKKFNRFSRPDARQSLLNKIFNKNGKLGKNTIDPEEVKRKKEEKLAEQTKKQELKELIKENEELQELSNNDIGSPSNSLTTTLKVSTVFPENELESTYLKVATIRSPYSFDLDEEGVKKSTRFITVTRTFTSSIQATTSSPDVEPSVQIIEPATASSSKPFFQTETIPAPENILTSSAFSPEGLQTDDGFGLSSSIETLPAVNFASSTFLSGVKTPPLKTITETFSTKEKLLKTSILPIVVNGKTSRHTLTQTYFVTRLVEAVKTLPPMEQYEFIPTKAFTDFSNVLDEAGSEKREQLLPGELEFSDQDDFNLDGPHEIRVKPPPGFQDDLALIGSKFDLADKMEKDNNPGIVSLKSSQTDLAASVNPVQSSFGSLNTAYNPFANLFGNLAGLGGQQATTQTPALPNNNPLAGLSQDQLRQLALLQYLQNPFAFNQQFNQPQAQPGGIVTANIPKYKTETVYATSTIPLFLGAKKFFTTLTQSIGMTTITEYETQTQSASPNGGLNNVFGGQPQQNAPAFGGNVFAPKPAFTVTSEAIVKDTVIPTTIYKDVKITFRNAPITTTLTQTSSISTQITSYVTRTIPLSQVQPTLNPFAGGFGGFNGNNPLAALLG